MPPAGGRTSNRNIKIAARLELWAERDGTGEAFDSSGGFTLRNGALRAPDAAWVERARLEKLSSEEQERFLPLCPTFVIELRSPSDPLAAVESKMDEYLDSGARLGWLIDPIERRVHVYRPGVEVEILEQPASVAGDPELPGFVLELGAIWKPTW
jgi:Uma2 family endonuclease